MPLPKGWSLAEDTEPVAQPTGLPAGWSLVDDSTKAGGPKDVNVDASHQENLPQYSFRNDLPRALKAAAEMEMRDGRGEVEELDPTYKVKSFAAKFLNSKAGDKLVDPISGVEITKTGDDTYTFKPEKASAVGAFGRAFAAATPGAVGSAVGIGAAQPLSSVLLASPSLPLKAAGLVTAIGGGIAGSIAASKAKEAILPTPDEVKAQLERDAKEQKIASVAGGLASQAPLFGIGGASLIQRAGMAGIGAGVPLATEGIPAVIQGKPLPDDIIEKMAEGAAGGALFANPTKAGERLIKVGESLPGAASLAKLAPKPKVKLDLAKPSTDITDNLGNAKAGQPLSKTQQDANQIAIGDINLGVKGEAPYVQEPAPAIEHGDLSLESGAGVPNASLPLKTLIENERLQPQNRDVAKSAEDSALVFELQKARADEAARRSAPMEPPGMLAAETALAGGAMHPAELDAMLKDFHQKQVENYLQKVKEVRESEQNVEITKMKEADQRKQVEQREQSLKDEDYAQELAVEVARQEGIPFEQVVATRSAHPNLKAWIEDLESIFAHGYKLSDKPKPTNIKDLVAKARSTLREKTYQDQQAALAKRNEQTKASVEAGLGEGEGFQPIELKEPMDFGDTPKSTERQGQEIKAFNDRVAKVYENLKAEGVELDRQTAAKLALIKDPQEFNAARQQLIDSVTPPKHDIPKAGPIKSLEGVPEVAGPRDLIGPRMPEVAAPKPLEQALSPVGQAKAAKSKAKAIAEPIKEVVPKPVKEPVKEPVMEEAPKPAIDAKEAIIQDPNLPADTKIELLQKLSAAKPKSDVATLREKLLARKREVAAKKAEPVVEAPKVEEPAPSPHDEMIERVMDLETNLDKKGVVSAANKAFGDGLITREQLVEIKRVAKDRDMDASDVGSQLKGDLEFNKTKASAPKEVSAPAPEPVKEPVAAEPIETTNPLEEKIAYLNEQLAANEITKEEHKSLVKEAKAQLKPSKKSKEAGFGNTAVMAHLTAPAVGAVIGASQGDTPEERIANAALYAAAFSGSAAALHAIARAAKNNPGMIKAFKEGFAVAKEENAKSPGLLAKLTAKEPAKPTSPDELGADHVLGNMGKSPKWDGGVLKEYPALADFVENITTHVDSLYEVHPRLAGALRNWMYEASSLLSNATTRSIDPLTKLREYVGKEQFEGPIWEALRDGREEQVLSQLDKSGPEGKVIADGIRNGWMKDRVEILEALKQASPNAEIGQLDNYWPQVVEDVAGLRKAMGYEMRDDLERAIAQKKKDLDVASLSDTQIGELATAVLTRPSVAGNTPGMGNTKARKLGAIPKEFQKFYAAPDLALAKYYQRAYDTVLSKKYLGKADPDGTVPWFKDDANTGIFGEILNEGRKDGSITSAGRQRAIENIRSFNKMAEGSLLAKKLAPKIGYIQVASNLGQLASAVQNLSDLFTTIAHTSARDALGGFFIDPLIKGERFKTLKDVNVQEGITEFYEHSKTNGKATWILDHTILPLFKKFDQFAKQGIVNANLRSLERGLKREGGERSFFSNGPSGRYELAKGRFGEMYGPEEWNKLADAVSKGEWHSDIVNKFAYNRLADVQPISKAEQVIGKSKATVGQKIAFGLTGFMFRQMNTLRSNAVNQWRRGNKWGAMEWVGSYMVMQTLAGSLIGSFKALINGDENAVPNNVSSMLLQTFGLNRVLVSQIVQGDASSALGERVLPGVFNLAKDIWHDVGLGISAARGNESGDLLQKSELVKRVPLVGDPYYWREGAGKAKREKDSRSPSGGQSDFQKLMDSIEGSGTPKRPTR